MQTGLIATIKREVFRLTGRKVYLFAMILVPLAVALFFLSLMSEGLPLKVPTAVVDLDNSTVSRKLTRSLKAQPTTEVTMELTSFNEAIEKVRNGEIFGFFYIPRNLEKDAVAGNKPTITYYSNMTYFVPGTLAYKGFRTIAVSTSGMMAASEVVQMGVDESTAQVLLQPVVIDVHGLGNPWTNYSYYLCNSFVPAALELMIFIVTVFSICVEIKTGESRMWLACADGSIIKALIGKLAPQTLVFFIVGMTIDVLFFKYNHFPMNGSWGVMLLAMLLFVIACQGFALFVTCAVPSLRMALSICSLLGILAFSVAGFSFPVEQMYGAIGIFSYILPVRYYFLIYIDQALNGIPMYFSREYFAALLVFAIAFIPLLFRLKKHLARPVYLL